MPHLESANERITRMEQTLSQEKKLDEFHLIRLEKLKKLTKTGSRLLPALAGFLKI
jgi:folylpolyglutamate synthase/dihydropteroate synthase